MHLNLLMKLKSYLIGYLRCLSVKALFVQDVMMARFIFMAIRMVG